MSVWGLGVEVGYNMHVFQCTMGSIVHVMVTTVIVHGIDKIRAFILS